MIYHKYSWLLSAVIKIPYGSLSLHICRFQQLPHASHSEQSEYLPLSSARSVHPFPEAVLLRPPGQFLCPQYQRPVPAVSFHLGKLAALHHRKRSGRRISSEVSFTFFGSPVSTFRPFTSITCGFASSIAVPIFILIASAVSDPINKLCVFRI